MDALAELASLPRVPRYDTAVTLKDGKVWMTSILIGIGIGRAS